MDVTPEVEAVLRVEPALVTAPCVLVKHISETDLMEEIRRSEAEQNLPPAGSAKYAIYRPIHSFSPANLHSASAIMGFTTRSLAATRPAERVLGDMVVEGNSRVTATKILHSAKSTDSKWTSVPVTKLPADVPERVVAMLMANFHIGGKTVWRPCAKADHIYELKHTHGFTVDQIADETRMTRRRVEQYLEAYQYLIDEVLPEVEKTGKYDRQEILERKFSHALEYISGKKLADHRVDPATRKTVAKLIANDKIKGVEVRELPSVLTHKKASSVLDTHGFTAAHAVLRKADPTVNSKLLKSMQQMTNTLKSTAQDDLELLKTNARAQTILLALAQSVQDVLAVTKLKVR